MKDKTTRSNLTVKEVAEYTRLSPRTIYNLVSQGKIPFTRISEKKVVFHREEIDQWRLQREEDRKDRSDGQDSEDPAGRKPSLPFFSKKNFPYFAGLGFLLISAAVFIFLLQPKLPEEKQDTPSSDTSSIVHSPGSESTIFSLERKSSEEDGEHILITLNTGIETIQMEGSPISPEIHPLLLRALKNPDGEYSIKSKTIDFILPYIDDEMFQQTLISQLILEENPILRMKILTALEGISTQPSVNRAIFECLEKDNNLGLRYKALEILGKSFSAELKVRLEAVLASETSPIIQSKIKSILKKQPES